MYAHEVIVLHTQKVKRTTLSVICFLLAFFIAINVQTMQTPLAGAWVMFFVVSCIYMAMDSHCYKDNKIYNACKLWLFTLAICTFIIMPVSNGLGTMCVLAAAPLIAISARESTFNAYLIGAMAIVLIYALLLIAEIFLPWEYTIYHKEVLWGVYHNASCWPMIDPNNAACVINCGLIPAFYLGLRDKKWFAIVGIFLFALFSTGSRTGGLCALIGFAGVSWKYFTEPGKLIVMLAGLAIVGLFASHWPYESIDQRFLLWRDSAQLFVNPWRGMGLGSFSHYYQMVRVETSTAGYFAHNDLYQIVLEMGIPATCVFLWVIRAAMLIDSPAKWVIVAIFLQSMMEFQFYVPAVSILFGLALGYQCCMYHIRQT